MRKVITEVQRIKVTTTKGEFTMYPLNNEVAYDDHRLYIKSAPIPPGSVPLDQRDDKYKRYVEKYKQLKDKPIEHVFILRNVIFYSIDPVWTS